MVAPRTRRGARSVRVGGVAPSQTRGRERHRRRSSRVPEPRRRRRGWFFRARRLRTDAPREDHRVALPRVHRRVRGLSPAPVPPFTATRRRDERRERVRGDGSRRGRRIGGDVSRRGRGIQIVRALRTRRARPRGARGGRRAARGEDARGCRSFRDARSREDASRRASGLRGVGRVSGTTRRRVGVDPRRDRGERRGGGDDARRRDTRGGTRGGTRETFSRGSLLRARGVASSR